MSSRPDSARATPATTVAEAYQIMEETFFRCKMEGKSLKETLRALRRAYPGDERRGYAYRAWLIARREFFLDYSLPAREPRRLRDVVKGLGQADGFASAQRRAGSMTISDTQQ